MTRSVALLLVLSAQQAAAQILPPIRTLGPVTASTTLSSVLDVRETVAGVLVHDVLARRIVQLDHELRPVRVVADSTAETGHRYGQYAGRLIAVGDSTLFLDPASGSLHVIGPDGQAVRVAAFPRPNDVGALVSREPPGGDPAGRVIYAIGTRAGQGGAGLTMGGRGGGRTHSADSLWLIAVDLRTRRVDTLTRVVIPTSAASVNMVDESATPVRLLEVDPLAANDGWAVLADGSVAVVRGSDYHVDLLRPDGQRLVSPRIPFAWQRLSDDGKAAYLDSLNSAQDAREARRGASSGQRMTIPEMGAVTRRAQSGEADVPGVHYEFVAASQLPDYRPAFRRGAVRADADGRIWVRLTTPADAEPGTLYDVLDGSGRRVDRVRVAEGRTIMGFGAQTVYLVSAQGESVLLERARLR